MKTILNLPMNIIRSIFSAISAFFSFIYKSIVALFSFIFRTITAIVAFIRRQIVAFIASFSKPMATSVLSMKGLVFAIVVGLFIAIVAVGVQPFGLSDFNHDSKTLYLVGFGVVAFVGMLFAKFVLPFVLKNFYAEQQWTVGKQVLHVAIILMIISGLMVLYSNAFNIQKFGFMDSLLFTAIGLIPAYILTIIQQNIYDKKYTNTAESINGNLGSLKFEEPKQLFPVISFGSGNTQKLSLLPNQLIFAENVGGSTDFYYQNLMGIEKKTTNATLKEIEAELTQHPQFMRLNANSFVNLRGIQKVEGNARGYRLTIARINQEIAVSRKFNGNFEKIVA